MTANPAAEDHPTGPAECWCCGCAEVPERMVHLGNHPEVMLCIGCAHAVSKWAWEIEDRDRNGVGVPAREQLRRAREGVIHRGWHQRRFIGGLLRWLGRHTP